MEKIIDNIFGEMEYKHSWTKRDSFIFLNKEYIVNITAQAYKGDKILESQQNNFKIYKEFLNKNNENIQEKLQKYFKDMFNTDASLTSLLKPTNIIFERDESWGILFESDCAIENGIAMFVENGNIKVGSQNEFI